MDGEKFVKDENQEYISGFIYPDAEVYDLATLKAEAGKDSLVYFYAEGRGIQPLFKTRNGCPEDQLGIFHYMKEGDIIVKKNDKGEWVQTYPALTPSGS